VIVATRRLGVRYGTIPAVEGLDLTAAPGEVLCLIGSNGSGKSSLMKALAGVVPMDGSITFDGSPVRPIDIGYMPQDVSGRASLTVIEVVLLGRLRQLGLKVEDADLAAVRQVLAELDLLQLAGRLLGELSGGQRLLVFLAQALVSAPRLVLLDEPISALDIRHQLEVLEMVRRITRQRRITTICVLHDLNAAARYADRVAMLRQGRLVATGAPAEVLTAATIANVFEVEARVMPGDDGIPVVTPLRPIAG
jgi:iron complex transport system ATP-binding protein